MISSLLAKIGAAVIAPLVFLTTVFAPQPIVEPVGVALPSATAVFETSLASPITAAATSMTLSSNSVRGGSTLSGYQCFTIDEGSAQAEYVCGTVSGTSVTSLERGLSPLNGTTTVAALSFSHRRGASVKITDFPVLQRIVLQSTGTGTYESPLRYSTSVSTTTLSTDGQNLASVAYANYLSFGGVAAASETTAGFGELATGQEAASSTQTGSAGRLVLPASLSTSTAPASGNVIPVTRIDGRLDAGFLASTTAQVRVTTYTASTTYTAPSGLRFITLEMWGGGGGGTSGALGAAGGGGGGEYKRFTIDAASIGSTATITIGAGGAASSAGGNTAFTFSGGTVYAWGGGANGGYGGFETANGSTTRQGSASSAVCASFGSCPAPISGTATSTFTYGGGGGTADGSANGNAGSSVYGGGGGGSARNGTLGTAGTSIFGGSGGAGSFSGNGTAGSVPGGGGGGAYNGTGGAGGKGMVRITEYF